MLSALCEFLNGKAKTKFFLPGECIQLPGFLSSPKPSQRKKMDNSLVVFEAAILRDGLRSGCHASILHEHLGTATPV
jgi:hypothetical protein